MDTITHNEISRMLEIINGLRNALEHNDVKYSDDTLQRLAVTIYLESSKKIYFSTQKNSNL